MTNKKILWGMLAVLLSFGILVVGCGGGGGDETVYPPPPPPPPATASVSISITDTSTVGGTSLRVYLSLYPSTAIWARCGNQHYSQLNVNSQEYITKLFSWITIKNKDGESLGVFGDASNQNYDNKILYFSSDVGNKNMLYLNIRVGKNIDLDELKPITATLNTSKLEEMKEYTNVTDSLTAGSKTSDTLSK